MPRPPKPTAKTADRHALYEQSVQAADVDSRFLSRYFRRRTGRPARILREDFCGTFALACEWVRLHRDHRAIGVDRHAPTLAWGRRHNLARLRPDQRARVRLIRGDVRDAGGPRADLTVALNFSYSVFRTRADLGGYLRAARRRLRPGGLYLLDAWGGSDVQKVQQDRRRCRGFTYVWDQAAFDPVSHSIRCRIHFRFDDGSELRNAFEYDWRLWTLPELRELMQEAGYTDIRVLWEGTDRRTLRGNGVYREIRRGEADPAWIAYVVGTNPGGTGR
jgi:SAM-dependent methyltransferase